MKWDVIFQPANLALYGQGVVTTLYLLLASLAIGALLALGFALALTSRWRVLRAVVERARALGKGLEVEATAPGGGATEGATLTLGVDHDLARTRVFYRDIGCEAFSRGRAVKLEDTMTGRMPSSLRCRKQG